MPVITFTGYFARSGQPGFSRPVCTCGAAGQMAVCLVLHEP
jgi:hypothetical protein